MTSLTIGLLEDMADAAFHTKPSTAKFRVGLGHGDGNLDPADADFENYRIVIEDSSGDLLGYQAQTVDGSTTYNKGANKIVFGQEAGFVECVVVDDYDSGRLKPVSMPPLCLASTSYAYKRFSNIRLSNRVTGDSALSPYYAAVITEDGVDSLAPLARPDGGADGVDGISYGNVAVVGALGTGVLYADPPSHYFDFPNDVFEDDGSYVIKAWAEDEDGTRISPVASIELSVREGDPVNESVSRYQGYGVTAEGAVALPARSWDGTTGNGGLVLSVYGLSIQDE